MVRNNAIFGMENSEERNWRSGASAQDGILEVKLSPRRSSGRNGLLEVNLSPSR
jgi:hypothetical protein